MTEPIGSDGAPLGDNRFAHVNLQLRPDQAGHTARPVLPEPPLDP